MKKNKYSLEQWKEVFTEKMKPTYEGWLFIGALLLSAICYDLELLFNIELRALSRISSIICFYSGSYYFCWFLSSLVFVILTKIKQHKDNKSNEGE